MPNSIQQIIDQVDPTKPIRGNATTESVRLNFNKIKAALSELNAYGEDLSDLFLDELDLSVFEQYKTNSRFYLDVQSGGAIDSLFSIPLVDQANVPLQIPSPVVFGTGITYDTNDRAIVISEDGNYCFFIKLNILPTGNGVLETRAAKKNGLNWAVIPESSEHTKRYSNGNEEVVTYILTSNFLANDRVYIYSNSSQTNVSFVSRAGTPLQNPNNPADIQTIKTLGARIQVARLA
jgi:hypothetical protein